jgi:hypothetical protein
MTAKKKEVYEWRVPWLYPGIDAGRVQRELSRIEPAGEISPEEIVDFAKGNPKSELSKCFEWDGRKAAHNWRMHQARAMLANLRKVTIKGGAVTLERTHFHVKGSGYLTKERLSEDPVAKSQVLHRARKAIEELLERCNEIETLANPKEVEHLSSRLLLELHTETEIEA